MHICKEFVLLSLFSLIFSSLVSAEKQIEKPSEESLVQAWELIQKNDPDTISFERIENRLYKFNNKKLNYNGKLKIKDAFIDVSMLGYGYEKDFVIGNIEIELVDISEAPHDLKKAPLYPEAIYGRRYSVWAVNNNLYYDLKTKKWISFNEYQGIQQKKYSYLSNPLLSFILSNLFWVVLVVLFVSLVGISAGKQKSHIRKALQLGQESLKMNEEANKLLKEILEVLKSKNQ